MKLSTGPDIRYGAGLADGSTITGSRKNVLESAVKAWKERAVSVVACHVPGLTALIKKQRCEQLEQDYRSQI